MDRWLHGFVFLVIALGALWGMNHYVWARIVRDTQLPSALRRVFTWSLIGLALLVAIAFTFGRALPAGGAGDPRRIVWLWGGFLFYVFLYVALLDLVALVLLAVRRVRRHLAEDREDAKPHVEPEIDQGRRALIARSLAGAAAVGAGGTVFAGRREAEDLTTPVIEVALPRLPRALDGYKIVQLSDVHIGPLLGARFLERVVDVANAQKPDLVVITGDLVDAPVKTLAPDFKVLRQLSARHGVVFVTGNHEYYSGAEEWVAWLRANGIRVLMNERVEIGGAGASFDLAGIPDKQGGMFFTDHEPDLARALAGRDPERELVLLAHRPSQIEMARGHGVGLHLAGHTHGGQLWPFGALVRLTEPYVSGLHTHDDGTQIYVSRGTGSWGPPLRIANPAEIGQIILRRG